MISLMAEQEEDLKSFFEELKDLYKEEKRDFVWEWEQIANSKDAGLFLCFIAYNLSRDVLHGPLPDHLHSRMVFDKNRWIKEYFSYINR